MSFGSMPANYDRSVNTAGSPLQRKMSLAPQPEDFAVDHHTDAEINQQREEQVLQLARTMSRSSTRDNIHKLHPARTNTSVAADGSYNIFEYDEGSDLDPFSNNFNSRKWTKGLVAAHNESTPGRTSGISYRNMSVHGFGSDAGGSPRAPE